MEIMIDVKVTKDEIYDELMKENEELDELTEECLWVLCCSCAILLKWQLKDQLPDGKYYKPSAEVMEETANTPKENIISERLCSSGSSVEAVTKYKYSCCEWNFLLHK